MASSRMVMGALGALVLAAGVAAGAWSYTHRTPAVVPPPPPAPEPHFTTKVARGEYLLSHFGCVACHGQRGVGGVHDENYIRDTIPALDLIAGRMRIFQKSDADKVVDLLEHGTDPHSVADHPPFDQYGIFLAEWDQTRALIQHGNTAGRRDPNGPAPPLNMPAWQGTVSDEDMNCLLAYLVTQEPWDADGYAPEETEPADETAEHAAGVVEGAEPHPVPGAAAPTAPGAPAPGEAAPSAAP